MYSQTELSNGLKIICSPLKNTQAVTVLVLLPVGSRYEEAGLAGASHFIEHMAFKGTRRRPSALAISRELDGVGAEFNAFTGKDHTGYWVKVASDQLELALDILSDILFHSKFAPSEIERERGVILEEIKMYEDTPLAYVSALFEKSIFGESPLGRLTIGKRKTVKEISRQNLLNFREKFYHPSNMLVVLAGSFKAKNALDPVKKYFGKEQPKLQMLEAELPTFEEYKRVGKEFRPGQKSARIKLHFKKTKQVHLALGTPAYSCFHPGRYGLNLLAIILGGNMSSRLFREVRERRGLAYFIHAETSVYQDKGVFEIHAGIDAGRIFQAIQVIMGELAKIARRGPTREELQRAKDYIKGKLTLALEDSADVAGWYGKQALLTGEILTLEERLAKFNRVTSPEVRKVAQELFKKDLLNLVLISPFKDERPFLKLLKI